MSAGEKADEYSIDYVLLADDYFAYLATNLIQVAGGEFEGRFRTHLIILSGESSRSLEGGFWATGRDGAAGYHLGGLDVIRPSAGLVVERRPRGQEAG
jgi:hypothetical protein